MEICSVGGYEEIGKNMTAIRIGDEVVILDCGIHPDIYIHHTEDMDIRDISAEELIRVGAIPDTSFIKDWIPDVKAIIPTHAHLDHVGAIPFLGKRFNAPIFGTPYTTEVLTTILNDEKIKIPNPIKTLPPNSSFELTKDITFEFINVTHSTPQTVMVAIHTPEGTVVYANDFKFDLNPVVGEKPNFKRLAELGKKGVKALIVDSTYALHEKKMPSESVARELLKDVMLATDAKGQAIVVTTFSSHLARIKSIVEFGKKLGRRIVFLGRSLSKYIGAGESIGIVNFSKDGKIYKYKRQIKRALSRIDKRDRGRYLFVVTGHQGEPKATLTKLINDELDFQLMQGDHVIFSCTVIPTETNKKNRDILESRLKERGVRIFKDIHVSGHAAKEDLRDLIHMLKPEFVIPAHGEEAMKGGLNALAKEMGYKDENILLLKDGDRAKIK